MSNFVVFVFAQKNGKPVEDLLAPFNENMGVKPYIMYNPNSKWDHWSIGGRWNSCITKLNGKPTNQAYVKDINWENSIIPLAFVTPNGEWHELGEMGIGEMAPYEKVYQDWEAEFKNYVADLDEDTIVTVVDCNIELPAE